MKRLLKKIYAFLCRKICLKPVKLYGVEPHVNKWCKFSRNTVIGNHCNFNGISIYGQGKVEIGDYFHSGEGIKIFTTYHNYEGGKRIPYDDTFVTRDVIIKECVWCGTDVTILAGVTIGEGAVIQNGSVVVNDIPDCGVVGGAPAKVFKYRDKEHYYRLKDEGAFF